MPTAVHPSPAIAELAHPWWLYEGLISGALPWQQAQPLAYEDFCQRYTLHDSHWVGLFQDISNQAEIITCLAWDTLWLPEEILSQCPAETLPYLLLKFTEPMGVTFSAVPADQADYPLNAGSSTAVGSDLPKRTITTFELTMVENHGVFLVDHADESALTIVFTGEIQFLALATPHQPLEL